MAKWIEFVLAGGVVNGKRLVSETGYQEWTKPQMKVTPDGKISYGFGWFIQDWNGLKVIQHGGNIDGFNSIVAMIPEKNIGFVMLTNVSASSLGSELMPIVWGNLLPENMPKGGTAIPADEAKLYEGKYRIVQANLDIEIKPDNDGLVMIVPGQPQYALSPTGPRSFKLLGAPDGFAVKFNPESGAATAMFLQQPQGNVTLPRLNSDGLLSTASANVAKDAGTAKPAAPPIATDELYAKVLAASGGEANWKKLTTRKITFDLNFVNQGVRGSGVSYAKAPDLTATDTTLTALGKKIGIVWEYFDGNGGGESYTFAPDDKYSGKRLEDVKLGADFYPALDWKTKFKKITVLRIAKVRDEDAYVVRFEPISASPFVDYYSTKSFLLLKRDGVITSSTGGPSLPYSVVYEDYRNVDGVMIPFLTMNESLSNGIVETKLVKVEQNVPIANSIFTPRTVKF